MERRGTLGSMIGASVLILAGSCTAILGIEQNYRENDGGAGGSDGMSSSSPASSSGTTTGSTTSGSSSSSSSGVGGGLPVVWNSWDAQTDLGNPTAMFVPDTNGQRQATIIPYLSVSLADLAVDATLAFFNAGPHPDAFNGVQD